jgi:hypothetical protein
MPPSDSQPLQPPSVNHLCQSALSVPRTKTSILPSPHDTAAGGEVSMPPSDSQSLQSRPVSHLCQSALSGPRPKTSSRAGPHEHTAGFWPGGPQSETEKEKALAVCALAIRDAAGRAAAPAASWRNRRSGSFIMIPPSTAGDRAEHGVDLRMRRADHTPIWISSEFRMVASRQHCRSSNRQNSSLRRQLSPEGTTSSRACGSAGRDVGFWRFSEIASAVSDGGLRVQSGLR